MAKRIKTRGSNEERSLLCYCYQTNTVYPSMSKCAAILGLHESSLRAYKREYWSGYRGYTFIFGESPMGAIIYGEE